MRLKKVFAGVLAAAMLVCAVAVPAFAAEEVEQENRLSSKIGRASCRERV